LSVSRKLNALAIPYAALYGMPVNRKSEILIGGL
jgi:hypothetical protein